MKSVKTDFPQNVCTWYVGVIISLVPRRTKVAPSIKCIRMRGIAYEKGAGIKGRSHENTSLP